MRAWINYLLMVAIVISSSAVNAQQAAENYRVDMTVANQSDAERIKAAKTGLSTLILRIVNDPAALQNAEVRQAIEAAPNYLTQFNYTSDNTLVLQYSQPAVTQMLRKAQLLSVTHIEQQQIVIHVINVQEFASFKQIQTYLKNLPSVQKVQLLAVDKLDMQIGLTLKKDQAAFETALATGNKLQVATGEKILPLSFTWHP